MPIVQPQPYVSTAHLGTTVVTQLPFLSPSSAPAPALLVPLGLHVVMMALSNHAPRVNTHLKDSRHVRHALTGSAVPIRLHLQSPSPQPPHPLPQIVQQRPRVGYTVCRETNTPSQLNKIERNISASLHRASCHQALVHCVSLTNFIASVCCQDCTSQEHIRTGS